MRRVDTSLVIAIAVSLAVHLTIGAAFVVYAGMAVLSQLAAQVEAPDTIPDAEPEPEPDSATLPEFQMGESTGTGYAAQAVESDFEATAREADADQAYLSLDPSGAGGKGSDAAIAQATGSGARRGQAGEPPAVFGLKSETRLPRRSDKTNPTRLITPAPAELTAVGQEGRVVSNAMPVVAANSTAPSAENGSSSVGTGSPAADPARMSDSESDPFSRLGSAEFRDGQLRVSFGRKVKTRTPRLLLGAQEALLVLQGAKVVLKIEIDATGKVTGVSVIKSSGSNAIDQPTRVAVYDWWFEPRKDDAGRAVPDEVQFSIVWR